MNPLFFEFLGIKIYYSNIMIILGLFAMLAVSLAMAKQKKLEQNYIYIFGLRRFAPRAAPGQSVLHYIQSPAFRRRSPAFLPKRRRLFPLRRFCRRRYSSLCRGAQIGQFFKAVRLPRARSRALHKHRPLE